MNYAQAQNLSLDTQLPSDGPRRAEIDYDSLAIQPTQKWPWEILS